VAGHEAAVAIGGRVRVSWPEPVRALRSPNYRLFFAGQSISLIGTWMTRIATSWLVYRLTGSALLLSLVSFAGQIPLFPGADRGRVDRPLESR
jgi:hypothetical protein